MTPEEMEDEIAQLNATVHYFKLRLDVATAAIAAEREACAKLVERLGRDEHPEYYAAAIRARKP